MKVKVTIAAEGAEPVSQEIAFATPEILEKVQAAPDGSKVTLELVPGADEIAEDTKLFDGTKEEAVEKVGRSVVPDEAVVEEFYRLSQFMFDHSRLKGVMISLVTSDGKELSKRGFSRTAGSCTYQAIDALVDCDKENCSRFETALREKRAEKPAEKPEEPDRATTDGQETEAPPETEGK